MKGSKWNYKPAIVRYIGKSGNDFTYGQLYEAFFLEYWQGERNSLHVRTNSGEITDFNPFELFEIVSDDDNVLNTYEAIVRYTRIKHVYSLRELQHGKEYKAIGRDKDGNYLVMDESYDCYFYPSDIFEIISDEHGILSKRSIYYNLYGCNIDLLDIDFDNPKD